MTWPQATVQEHTDTGNMVREQNWHVDQNNRIESPETNADHYCCLILDNDVKNMHWKQNIASSTSGTDEISYLNEKVEIIFICFIFHKKSIVIISPLNNFRIITND